MRHAKKHDDMAPKKGKNSQQRLSLRKPRCWTYETKSLNMFKELTETMSKELKVIMMSHQISIHRNYFKNQLFQSIKKLKLKFSRRVQQHIELAEERIRKIEDMSIEMIQSKIQAKKKEQRKKGQRLRDPWDIIKFTNIHIKEVKEEKREREKGIERLF